jgi:hypothetical protein
VFNWLIQLQRALGITRALPGLRISPEMCRTLKLAFGGLLLAAQLPASTFLFTTPSGAVNPHDGTPVSVTALFTTSNGHLQITVQNTEVDPLSESASLVNVTFQVSQSLTSPSMTSSALIATVNSNGSYSTSGPTTTHWTLTTNGSTLTLCGTCDSSYPKYTLLGAPKASTGRYTDANSTIKGSSSDNPFLWETAGYTITAGALTQDVVISHVIFYFGTTDSSVNGVGGLVVPEPSTIRLFAGGALLLVLAGCRRKSFQ